MGSSYVNRDCITSINGDTINSPSNWRLCQTLKNTSPIVGNGVVSKDETNNPTNDMPINGTIAVQNGNECPQLPQTTQLPFPKLSGESVLFTGPTTEGSIVLTNYRVFISYSNSKDGNLPMSLPLGTIETVECRDLFYLYIYTKNVRSIICSLASGDECTIWYKRLIEICLHQSKLDNLFCFKHFLSTISECDSDPNPLLNDTRKCYDSRDIMEKEFKRLGFDESKLWRICDINKDFKLCLSYPKCFIVPNDVPDKDLESVANFRYSRRIPTAVWRHAKNGCVIARSSQPEVGWLGWRNSQDEHLLLSIVSASNSANKSKKLLIVDARSYAAAVANRAKGGGCECPEYYPCCEVQFMSLANIHSIRKSFHCIRYICESPADQFNWLTLLDNSKWLNNISGLIKAALIVVNAIDIEERPVLVHCSDGWDRTPQIVALAELMLDPYYRTFEGFQVLVEREWVFFGHKFADRCGHGSSTDDLNERCPVFIQWIDCVHQLMRQFPCYFEFNLHYLIKLIQHTYSCLFGTFLCNNMQERYNYQIYERTFPLWSYFAVSKQQFINYVYIQNDQVLRPSCKAKDIVFWSDVYMPLSSSISGAFLSATIPNATPVKSHAASDGDNSTNSHNSKDSEIDSKHNGDGDSSVIINETNETESDMETIASDKNHCNLAKTRSCENISIEDNPPYDGEKIFRTRHCSDPNLFRSLCFADQFETITNGKCVDILKYLRDLQLNGTSVTRDCCDRDSQHESSNRDYDNCLFDNGDVGSSHFSMLSTETLLNGASANNDTNKCDYHGDCSLLSNLLTTSTSTTELSNSSIQNNDVTVHFDKLYHSVYCQRKRQQHSNQILDNVPINCNNANGNGKHTRTPSSGCPATPNDEHCSDASPYEMGNQSQEVFDIDGQILLRDKVQMRLQQIVAHHKAEVDNLRKELYYARIALCQQLKFCSNGSLDNPKDENNGIANAAHSMDNGYSLIDNTLTMSSLDSWINVIPQHITNSNSNDLSSLNCTKNDLSNQPYSILEANNMNCDGSVKMNSPRMEQNDDQ